MSLLSESLGLLITPAVLSLRNFSLTQTYGATQFECDKKIWTFVNIYSFETV